MLKSIERFGDLRVRQTKAQVLMQYVPDRRIIAEICEHPSYSLREMPNVLDALIRLCTEADVTYYPGEAPRWTNKKSQCNLCSLILDEYVQTHHAS